MVNLQELRQQAKREADRMREQVFGDTIPVDPVRIARHLGIKVLVARTSEGVSGMIRKLVGHDPEIVISRDDSEPRQRFTCAHELGHWVRRSGDEEFRFVDLRVNERAGDKPVEEIFADEFAGNLLMPEAFVREAVKELGRELTEFTIWELARRFGVSAPAMRVRLSKLELLRK